MNEAHTSGADVTGAKPPPAWRALLTRFGFLGFMFFLIKGLLWLAIPATLAVLAWFDGTP